MAQRAIAAAVMLALGGSMALSAAGQAVGPFKPARPVRRSPAQRPDPASPFGLHRDGPFPRRPRQVAQIFDAVAATGASWLRVNVWWEQIEPAEGRRRWAVTDRIVSNAQRVGVQLLVTVRGYSDTPLYHSSPGDRLPAFARLLSEMVERYRGRVTYWQIENEITAWRTWKGTTEDYLALLQASADAIRKTDGASRVVLGSVGSAQLVQSAEGALSGAQETAVDFDTVLRRGSEYFDIVDLHLYHDIDGIAQRVGRVRNRMRELGYVRPIWSSEAGGPDPRVEPVAAEDLQAVPVDMVERFAVALAAGVERMFWHQLRVRKGRHTIWSGMALMEGNRLRPAFTTFRVMTRKLGVPRRVTALDLGADVRALKFSRADTDMLVVWRRTPGTLDLVTPGLVGRESVRVVDVSGAPREENPRALSVGPSPVFARLARGRRAPRPAVDER